MKNILEVSKADVMEVYSGRPGCACGCQGKYSVNPAHKALADAKRAMYWMTTSTWRRFRVY